MGFREDLASRGWLLKSGSKVPATHLFLHGGKAAVPDDHAGTFLNMYTNAHLRGERLCVVELKTSKFKLFFDIDAQVVVNEAASQDCFLAIFERINQVATAFWVLPTPPRLIVCTAPPKELECGDTKLGFHLHWPTLVVNAPIALAFREAVLTMLGELEGSSSIVVNAWADVVDASVLKANGIRMIFSEKKDVPRPYTPIALLGEAADTLLEPSTMTAQDRRQYVLETSVRTFHDDLTPCHSGIDQLADDVKYGRVKHGCAVHLEIYAEILPKVQAALPEIYKTQQFTGVFKLEHAVMLRSSSRYCQHAQREHQTSNIYFIVTRRGVAQRCYCRKEDRGCGDFCSDFYGLPLEIIDAFLPPVSAPHQDMLKMPSKKRTSGDLHAMLSRSRPLSKSSKKKN